MLRAPSCRSSSLATGLTLLLVVAAASAWAGDGRSSLERAPSSSDYWPFDGDLANAAAGTAVATIGDVDGDGYDDFAYGAPFFDAPDDGFGPLGQVVVRFGAPGGYRASSQEIRGSVSSQFGSTIAPAGDVNGDGYDDLIVGAPAANFDGTVYVFLGSPTGLQTPAAWSYHYIDAGIVPARLGATVSGAGDVDADGYDDVVVGAPDSGDFEGFALLFRGRAVGALSPTPDWFAEGGPGWRLGTSVSAAGDVDADGFADVIVGVPGWSGGTPQGDPLYGGAFLYRGGWPGGSLGLPGLTPYTATRLGGDQQGGGFGASVSLAGDVNGDGYGDVVVGEPDYDAFALTGLGRASVFLGGPGGLDATPFWFEYGLAAGDRFGARVATAGDVDGDGLADVVVAAPEHTNTATHEGMVAVVQGSRSSMLISWIGRSGIAYGRMGSSLATAGDPNDDGFSELIVGIPGASTALSGQGRVHVYVGHADAPGGASSWQTRGAVPSSFTGWVVAPAGDLDGDGFDDLVVTAPNDSRVLPNDGSVTVHFGSPTGPGAVRTWTVSGFSSSTSFGYSAACAGDVNGDGYDDLIVGAPHTAGLGHAFIWYGGSGGPHTGFPDWSADGPQVGSQFGWSVAGAGDVNGDGYADVIVGAPHATGTYAQEGQAFLYLGSPSGPSVFPAWSMLGNQELAGLGNSVASAGDVNRDGYADVIVGMELWDRPINILLTLADVGRAFVLHGSPSGLPPVGVNTILQGTANDRFGTVVASAGDVDGDGYSDVIVTAIGKEPSDSGAVYVFRGSDTGVTTTAYWGFATGQAFSGLGVSAASAGDVNRDGYSDVIVGANFHDGSSRIDNGHVWVFAGPDLSSPAALLREYEGAASYENLGQSCAGVGDLNGDGFADLAVGSTGFTGTISTQGRAQVYYGNGGLGAVAATDATARGLRQFSVPSMTPLALGGRPSNGASFGIELRTSSPAGRVRTRLQWEVATLDGRLDGTNVTTYAWVDNLPAGPGSTPVLSASTHMAAAEGPALWRARIESDSPYFPRSPWFSPPRNAQQEADLRFDPAATAVVPSLPSRFVALEVQAAPNPFNPRTSIGFTLPIGARVVVEVHDARGRLVRRLLDEEREVGRHDVAWDGTDGHGSAVASGVYFARVRAADLGGSVRLALVR